MLAISSYLINLLSITGDVYQKTLKLKAYSDTLKKHLFGILEYAEVKFFLSSHALSNLQELTISESRIQWASDSL